MDSAILSLAGAFVLSIIGLFVFIWSLRKGLLVENLMFGGAMYFLSSIQGSLESLRSMNAVTHFTHYTVSHAHLGAYAFVTMVLGGAAYILFSEPFGAPGLGDRRTLADLRPAAGAAGGSADGKQVFAGNCASCHQATGKGLPGVFPPLAGSEWVTGEERAAPFHGGAELKALMKGS